MKIGIDFGTTNSAVCYHQNGELKSVDFSPALQQGSELYMPTVVAKRTRMGRNETFFGQAAKALVGQPNASVYQNVKMLLDADHSTLNAHWSNRAEKPEDIAQHFIEHLLARSQEVIGEPIEAISFTIPEVWDRTQSKSTTVLADIFRKAARGSVDISVSSRREPVAAAAYFLHKWKEKKPNQPFSGHLLVCDCGGGTMDYCLVEAMQQAGSEDKITPLERAGYGSSSKNNIGHAGVAFDQGAVKKIFHNVTDPHEFSGYVNEFERLKINHQSDLKEYVQTYRISPDMCINEPCFHIRNTSIYIQDLIKVFDEIVIPNIQESIKNLKDSFSFHKVNSDDPLKFRVILVGGFSAFYLTQEAIRKVFGSQLEDDWRFDDLLNDGERALAIAKGAALFASEMVQERVVSPVEIGVIATNYNLIDKTSVEVFYPVVSKGNELKDLISKTKWSDTEFSFPETNEPWQLYLDPKIGGLSTPIKFDLSINQVRGLLPNAKEVKLGYSVDSDRVFYLHVEDIDATKKKGSQVKSKIRLGDLLQKVPSLMVVN